MEIQLVINSPGGDIETGYLFMDMMRAIQARGTHIECFVPRMAASIAYIILMNCDSRYVLNNSRLLWHHSRIPAISEELGAIELYTLALELDAIDQKMYKELCEHMEVDMSSDTILYHFNHETLHRGNVLAKLLPHVMSSYSYIPGLLEVLVDPQVPRTPLESTNRKKTGRYRGPGYTYWRQMNEAN